MAELEQFCILAQKQKGRACDALIQQVLNNKKIFVFSELLAVPSVASLRESEYVKSYNTLDLFAFGRYLDYAANRDSFLSLTEAQQRKLKQLSLVSLAQDQKVLTYANLQHELGIDNLRNLEDLIIDTIYAGLISGKIDQRRALFRVRDTMARDVRVEKLDDIIASLETWKGTCATLLETIAESSSTVLRHRMNASAEQEETQKQADKLKATLKDAIISGDGEMREYDDDDEDLDDGIPSVGYRPGVGSKTTTVRSTKRNRFGFGGGDRIG